ncbi:reductase [Streptomyces sp. Ru71]|uniref:NAD-dependent epimerase/dehydratase family protein n=1 Tax=Streptomyces sp. Ru71 TaxID=2080746 RepID=UPI000CDDF986|nr:NAD-dependent epimerase/dehydratase family protein [Streptomyces sp. Ru71]POX44776.1 reductase [Streptomyces sp. Ru71]
MKRALVIGATGQIGRPTVRALAEDGWEVLAASRGGGRDAGWPDGVRAVRLDREDDGALASVVGDGCDVVVDTVAYGARHARQLTGLAGRVGSAVVISSVAVYQDGRGRSFDTQDRPDGVPRYPVPLPEEQPTVSPGEDTYAMGKVALERELLGAGEKLPATLLRAAAVHGPYSPLPRELYFVKRNLDGRRRRVLAHRGESRFHPSGAGTIAELVRLAAARPGSRVLNACDPTAPSVAEIGAAVDAAMGVETETVLLDGEPPSPSVGRTPWSTRWPLVCDMSAAARELGYGPGVPYAESVRASVDWLVERLAGGRDWREEFPLLARAYPELFDYAAEDVWLGV